MNTNITKTCIICSSKFDGTYPSNKICCSPECSKINQKNFEYKPSRKNYKREYEYRKNRRNYKSEYYSLPTFKLKHLKYQKTDMYKKWEKEYLKKYRQTKKYKHYQSLWLKTKVGKISSHNGYLKRRALLNNYIETYTNKEWNKKINKTKGFCPGFERKKHYVGIFKLTKDHNPAVSIASKIYKETGVKINYTINNMQPLCRGCNARKYNK